MRRLRRHRARRRGHRQRLVSASQRLSVAARSEAFGGFLGPSSDRFPAILAPSVDVRETDNAVEVEAELPGVDEKDIQLTLEDDVLTIKGEKKLEKQETRRGYRVSERSYGSFYRSLPMPAGIDADKVNAVFAKGVLRITLPKPAEAQARTRKIEVKPSESAGAGSSAARPGQGGLVEGRR